MPVERQSRRTQEATQKVSMCLTGVRPADISLWRHLNQNPQEPLFESSFQLPPRLTSIDHVTSKSHDGHGRSN
jgi:hypothetical protein